MSPTHLTLLNGALHFSESVISLEPLPLPILNLSTDPSVYVIGQNKDATAGSPNMSEVKRVIFGQAAVLPQITDALLEQLCRCLQREVVRGDPVGHAVLLCSRRAEEPQLLFWGS
jgi:hypothetical protein